MTNEELDQMFRESFMRKAENILRTAILWKFPNISNLEVSYNETDDTIKVSFADDGVHTQDEVTKFLEDLRKAAV